MMFDQKIALEQLNKFRGIDNLEKYQFDFQNKLINGFQIEKKDEKIQIIYDQPADLMRAYNTVLGLIKNKENKNFNAKKQFSDLIAMIDLARNAVLSVENFKKEIVRLASLGYTEIWLYLEDEFEIPNEPYFGLQRGRYSQDELHELAVFADKLGVTLVPAIQALAHLKNVFKWEHFGNIRDTVDNLYVGKEATKKFVKEELEAATKPFLTDKIHLGMDEAHSLGLGRYFFDHQKVDQYELMKEHVAMVLDLCKQMNLKPVMWSDMWFEIGSPTHLMYDPNANLKEFNADRNLGQVYWDYYSTDLNHYLPIMKKHFELSNNVYFAAGIWTWGRLAPNQSKMLATIKAGLTAAKKSGIKKVAATAWKDDGAETPFTSSYLGWQVFSDYQYHDQPDHHIFAINFALLQDEDYQSYMLLDKFDNLKNTVNEKDAIPSKLLLYEDLIQPRYYHNLPYQKFSKYYKDLSKKLEEVKPSLVSQEMFEYYLRLAKALTKKAELMVNLSNEKASADELKDYSKKIKHLAKLRMIIWFNENKVNGSEILDIRFGGMLQRIKTVKYLLENKRYKMEIPSEEMDRHIDADFGNGRYFEIVSPSDISW